MTLQWEYVPQDVWIGIYWTRREGILHLYLCLVPCFPLHITLPRKEHPRDIR
jgi:hypothetical protein